MICWPQGLVENWPAVLEAVATLLLVIAAGFQWWTMRGQAQQERERWKREDEISKEANRPKAEFWFATDTKNYQLTGINLGQVAFVLREIWARAVIFREVDVRAPGGPICLQKNVNLPMPIGEKVEMAMSMEKIDDWLKRPDGGCNWEFIFRVSTPYGVYEEIQRPFNTCGALGMDRGIWQGFMGTVQAQCPACKTQCDSIMVNDLNSSEEIEKRLDTIHQEYRQTCPTHATTSDKVYVMPTPSSDAPRYDG